MSRLVWLAIAWGLVTIPFIVLLIYRSRLEGQESDWIDLTDDAREDQAIQKQAAIEKKVHKFDTPIRALGAVSVVLLLVIVGLWLYSGITTPPPPPE
ncbi:MAG: hypothetical protein HYS33_04860 [Acidobacteria bacterium]|nr:hypothetical protein [Acidobacteriota bacterium]